MIVSETAIAGLLKVKLQRHGDERGSFSRLYCDSELATFMGSSSVVEVNHSVTDRAGSVRGMHYQRPPHAEIKLITCLRGSVFDVAVDLRAGSPTFLQWLGQELTAQDDLLWVIPEGVAHGFQALEDSSELLYFHSAHYTPEAEAGIRFDDPRLAIDWPLATTEISSRDLAFEPLSNSFDGVVLAGSG
ncbi:MAG: dTDP-4-dehydrorhamnose 3,5-epimerase family protein [Halieaceae bacterium]